MLATAVDVRGQSHPGQHQEGQLESLAELAHGVGAFLADAEQQVADGQVVAAVLDPQRSVLSLAHAEAGVRVQRVGRQLTAYKPGFVVDVAHVVERHIDTTTAVEAISEELRAQRAIRVIQH